MKKLTTVIIVVIFALTVLAASVSIAFSTAQCCCVDYYAAKLTSGSLAQQGKTVNVAPYATSMNILLNE